MAVCMRVAPAACAAAFEPDSNDNRVRLSFVRSITRAVRLDTVV